MAAITNTAARDGRGTRIKLPQDPGQAGKMQVQHITRLLSGYSVTSSTISGDKVKRAEPFASQVNVGNIAMLRAEWNNALIAEMRMFPNGKNDDQIDASSDAFNELNSGGNGLFDYYRSMATEVNQHAKPAA